ncbi:MAG: hypothetical protein OEV51_04090, partial [Nitrospira sp.]|nr:hypothetical protein [Nitrospira sp.]
TGNSHSKDALEHARESMKHVEESLAHAEEISQLLKEKRLSRKAQPTPYGRLSNAGVSFLNASAAW